MWSKIYFISSLIIGTLAEMPLGITRSLSDGVKSAGYKVIYGDEDLTILNEVFNEHEKVNVLKSDTNLKEALPPLPPEDVKCLISVDRHCSKDMGEIKAVLIKAIKDDCKQCTTDQKEKAGKVIASVMAHDPMAWKLFLTRYGGMDKVQKLIGSALIAKSRYTSKEDIPKTKVVGNSEDVLQSKERYIFPGVKVRVKRYAAEKV